MIRQEMAPLVSEAPHRHLGAPQTPHMHGAPLINALVLCEFLGTPLQMAMHIENKQGNALYFSNLPCHLYLYVLFHTLF